MLISENYRQLNRQMHADKPQYGSGGARHAQHLVRIADQYGASTILDYGCGKGDLKRAMPAWEVREYDPAIEGKDSSPEPADLVYCGDVLEHIEHEFLGAVFDDLRRCTRKVAVLVISTVQSKKFLSDGRNAHLIVQPLKWWLPLIWDRWELAEVSKAQWGFMTICEAQ